MIDAASIASDTPSRLRLKVPARKGDAAYFEALKGLYSGIDGVKGVEVNAITASVLFTHSIRSEHIIKLGEDSGLFKATAPSSGGGVGRFFTQGQVQQGGNVSVASRISRGFSFFDSRIRGLTGGELDIPTIASLALAAFAVYQIRRGRFAAPAWYTLIWYALNIFLKGLPSSHAEPV